MFSSLFFQFLWLTTCLGHPSTLRSLAKRATNTATQFFNLPAGVYPQGILVRKNGGLLTTIATGPELYQVAPDSAQDSLMIHRFYGSTTVAGIAQLVQDVFYVGVGNFSFSPFTTYPGSWSLWQVDMRNVGTNQQVSQCQVTVTNGCRTSASLSKVVDVPQIAIMNGLTPLNVTTGLLLAGDSGDSTGSLYVIDTNKKTVQKLFAFGDYIKRNGSLGLNGLKYINNTLYFTMTSQPLFGSVKLDPTSGNMTGTPQVLITNSYLDGINFDSNGNLYGALASGGVGYVPAPITNTSTVQVIASQIPGPTSLQFGKMASGANVLFAADSGGDAQYFQGNVTKAGGIWSVTL